MRVLYSVGKDEGGVCGVFSRGGDGAGKVVGGKVNGLWVAFTMSGRDLNVVAVVVFHCGEELLVGVAV